MFKTLSFVSLCLVMLTSVAQADETADFRSALQVTFPATVAVRSSNQAVPPDANRRNQNNRMQRWQQRGMQGDLFGMPIPELATIGRSPAVHTGFAISPQHVLTQWTDSSDELTITTVDNTQHDAKVVARDHVTGLCVAKVDGVDLVSLVIGDAAPQPGLPVVTTWIEQGVRRCKSGMISSPLNASQPQLGMTQFVDFANARSVLGSPIVDTSGVLVGVTVDGDDGAIVCLPATQLNRLIDAALADEPKDLQRGLVGIAFSSDNGAVVNSVADGLPGDEAGLEPGDQVTQIDDHAIRSSRDVIAAVAMARAGDSVKVTVKRGDETLTRTMTLSQHPHQRISLSPLQADRQDGNPIVRQQGWQMKDGKLVPMDRDADGNLDMVLPKELRDMLQNGADALPNQFRMPRPFQGPRIDRRGTEEAIRELESERDRQADKIKELSEKIQELESKNGVD